MIGFPFLSSPFTPLLVYGVFVGFPPLPFVRPTFGNVSSCLSPSRMATTANEASPLSLQEHGAHKIVAAEGMAPDAVSLLSVGAHRAAFSGAVSVIVGPRAQPEMIWIDAGGRIAAVENAHAVWNSAVFLNPHGAMGSDDAARVSADSSISGLVPIPTEQPTPGLLIDGCFREKPIQKWLFSHRWKYNTDAPPKYKVIGVSAVRKKKIAVAVA